LGPALAWAWQERAQPAERFLIAWIVPFWLVLELVPTKLPHYILPVYPALALLAGRAVLALGDGALIRRRWLDAVVTLLWVAVALALAAAVLLAPHRRFLGHGQDASVLAIAAIVLVFGGWLALSAWRRAGPLLVAHVVLLAVLVFAPASQWVAPALDQLWLSRAAAAAVARYRPPPDAPVVAVGYSEPSLVFLLGTGTRFLSADQAAEYIASVRGAAALVSNREDPAFRRALKSRGWEPRFIDAVDGLDYSNGKRMILTLYTGVPG